METSSIFKNAAVDLDTNWKQGDLGNASYNGERCLVGGLSFAQHRGNNIAYDLTLEIANELHRQLRFSPVYWVARVLRSYATLEFASPRQGKHRARINKITAGATGWNDIPWRRNNKVVRVLNKAAKHAKKHEKARWETDKLQHSITVANLKEEIRMLRARVTQLESQNAHLWRRISNERQIKADNEKLNELDQELNQLLGV